MSEAVPKGLCAMETQYSKYDKETTMKAQNIAMKFGLCESGGSDFHGDKKPDISIGIGRGDLAVPHEILERLKSRNL